MNACDCWGPDDRLETKISEIDISHIYVSYASYDIKCHIMTNDAYDIEIWHKSIWSILVSKRPSGPQQSHAFIRFWVKNGLKIKRLKCASKYILGKIPGGLFQIYWSLFYIQNKVHITFFTFQFPWMFHFYMSFLLSLCHQTTFQTTFLSNYLYGF